ncbi:hypothetical protein HK096_009168 [Nowakowskiella sp. JEL0078]|nr:hypothetical protein HK096_009168 [Nowakowskiella sp. JEL0078]
MKITLIGPGKTGKQLIALALASPSNNTVTVLARSGISHASLQTYQNNPHLKAVKGDINQIDAITAACKDSDAIVICVGHTYNDPGIPLVETTVRNVIEVMKKTARKRLVIVSEIAFEWSSVTKATSWSLRMFLKWLLDNMLLDHQRAEKLIVREKNWLEYTIVAPPMLIETSATGYVLAENALPPADNFALSHQDLAACLLDLVESNTHLKVKCGAVSKEAKDPFSLIDRHNVWPVIYMCARNAWYKYASYAGILISIALGVGLLTLFMKK